MTNAASTARDQPEPLVLQAPPEGWTWASYVQAIQRFTRERGRAPRTVRLHPETLETVLRTRLWQAEQAVVERAVGALQQEEARLAQRLQDASPSLEVVTEHTQDRQTLVLM